jgi:hypothetical protein
MKRWVLFITLLLLFFCLNILSCGKERVESSGIGKIIPDNAVSSNEETLN